MPPKKAEGEGLDLGLPHMPKDTPSAKAWPIANMLIAAGMGSSLIIAFHLLSLIISFVPNPDIRAFSYVLYVAICFASFFAGLMCAFVLRNLEGRMLDKPHNAFAGAISGLLGSAIGILISVGVDTFNNMSSSDALIGSIAVRIMLGGFLSIMSSLFAALGALAFVFLSKE